jgi:hypothetical protein
MGDRVANARPAELESKMKKMKEKRDREEKARLEEQRKSKKRSKGGDFIENLGALHYLHAVSLHVYSNIDCSILVSITGRS